MPPAEGSVPVLDRAVALGAALCVATVLAAVIWDHVRFRATGRVEAQVKSPIATGTMLGFLAVVLWLLGLRGAVVPLAPAARTGAMLAGLGLMLAGAAVNVAGRLQLDRNWADQVTLYRDQTLVRSGVYRVVRHPIYASLVWMFVGGALVYRNAAVLAATLVVFLPAMVVRARQEERLLAQRFPEYAEYRRRVGMLLPRPARNREEP